LEVGVWARVQLKQIKILNYTLLKTKYAHFYLIQTYSYHARWHQCMRFCGLSVGWTRNTQRKPTCQTCWLHDHL